MPTYKTIKVTNNKKTKTIMNAMASIVSFLLSGNKALNNKVINFAIKNKKKNDIANTKLTAMQ